MPFKLPFTGLYDAFKRSSKGLLKATQRPLKDLPFEGHSKAFEGAVTCPLKGFKPSSSLFTGLYKALDRPLKAFYRPLKDLYRIAEGL